MADRLRDQSPDKQGTGNPPDAAPLRQQDRGIGRDRGSDDDALKAGSAPLERQKAKTEIAAGEVADDLADFA